MKTALFFFGRFQPFTKGHLALMNAAHLKYDDAASYFIATSDTCDAERNPLTYFEKVRYMTPLIPEWCDFVQDLSVSDPPTFAEYLKARGFERVIFAVGSDRIQDMTRSGWHEKLGVEVEGFLPSRETQENDVSATRARAAAVADDLATFLDCSAVDHSRLTEWCFQIIHRRMNPIPDAPKPLKPKPVRKKKVSPKK